jgi:hypothetical protein
MSRRALDRIQPTLLCLAVVCALVGSFVIGFGLAVLPAKVGAVYLLAGALNLIMTVSLTRRYRYNRRALRWFRAVMGHDDRA